RCIVKRDRYYIGHRITTSVSGGGECKCNRTIVDLSLRRIINRVQYIARRSEGSVTAAPASATGYGYTTVELSRWIVGTGSLIRAGIRSRCRAVVNGHRVRLRITGTVSG